MHQIEKLEIPQELMESFDKQSQDQVNLIMEEGLIDTEKSPYDLMVFAYKQALQDIYKRNNGIPTIPYPLSLSTVDMIVISYIDNDIMIMFGRKPGQKNWQFPGGFRDPSETSRQAASRELKEEACLDIAPANLHLIEELFVDDIRYRNSPHKITTSIFITEVLPEQMILANPGDDLEEISWYALSHLKSDNSIVRDIHIPILDILIKHLA
jgi:ADP-ribose pyrophosphatase YjhB (NUDIX family)